MVSGNLKLYHLGGLSENVYMKKTKKKKREIHLQLFFVKQRILILCLHRNIFI